MTFPFVERTYTKNTNTRIQHMTKCQKDPTCGIFLKRGLFKDMKKGYSCLSNAKMQKIQIHKYTNAQIQHMTKCQKDPTCGIFLKRGLFKDIKNYIPICQTRKYKKYKDTNTQIQHMTKCQKDPTCGTFFKRGLFKDFKNNPKTVRTIQKLS